MFSKKLIYFWNVCLRYNDMSVFCLHTIFTSLSHLYLHSSVSASPANLISYFSWNVYRSLPFYILLIRDGLHLSHAPYVRRSHPPREHSVQDSYFLLFSPDIDVNSVLESDWLFIEVALKKRRNKVDSVEVLCSVSLWKSFRLILINNIEVKHDVWKY
jgi:hypothetical protein